MESESSSKQVTVVIEAQNGEKKVTNCAIRADSSKQHQIHLTSNTTLVNIKEQLTLSQGSNLLLWSSEANSFQAFRASDVDYIRNASEVLIKIEETPSSSADNTNNHTSSPDKTRSNSFGVKPRSNSGRQMLSTHRKGSKPEQQDDQAPNANDTPSNSN